MRAVVLFHLRNAEGKRNGSGRGDPSATGGSLPDRSGPNAPVNESYNILQSLQSVTSVIFCRTKSEKSIKKMSAFMSRKLIDEREDP